MATGNERTTDAVIAEADRVRRALADVTDRLDQHTAALRIEVARRRQIREHDGRAE